VNNCNFSCRVSKAFNGASNSVRAEDLFVVAIEQFVLDHGTSMNGIDEESDNRGGRHEEVRVRGSDLGRSFNKSVAASPLELAVFSLDRIPINMGLCLLVEAARDSVRKSFATHVVLLNDYGTFLAIREEEKRIRASGTLQESIINESSIALADCSLTALNTSTMTEAVLFTTIARLEAATSVRVLDMTLLTCITILASVRELALTDT